MYVLTGDSANDLYTGVCRAVLSQGRRAAPRGMATTELLGAHLCLTEPRRRFVAVPPARVLNPAFAVAEALWILSGSDDPWIFTYNRNLRQYADNGRLQGAYGPRVRAARCRGVSAPCRRVSAALMTVERTSSPRRALPPKGLPRPAGQDLATGDEDFVARGFDVRCSGGWP